MGGNSRRASSADTSSSGSPNVFAPPARRDVEPRLLPPPRLAPELPQPLPRRREPERPDLPPAGLESRLLLERAVELDRAHHHPGQAERPAQLPDEAGGVERRAARQVGALAEDDVAPAQAGEPVQDRGAADATAHDDRARRCPHRPTLSGSQAETGGNRRRITAPPSSPRSAVTAPPCDSALLWTIDNPSPDPGIPRADGAR